MTITLKQKAGETMSFTLGIVAVYQGQKIIRNVVGSSYDPLPLQWDASTPISNLDFNISPFNSWVDLWRKYTGESTNVNCCVCGRSFDPQNNLDLTKSNNDYRTRTGVDLPTHLQKTDHKLVGGHVVLGFQGMTDAAPSDKYSLQKTNRVFIAPICSLCNRQSLPMQLVENAKIVNLVCFNEESYPYSIENYMSPDSGNTQYIKKKEAWAAQQRAKLFTQQTLSSEDDNIIRNAHPSLPASLMVYKPFAPVEERHTPSSHRSTPSSYGYGRDDFVWMK